MGIATLYFYLPACYKLGELEIGVLLRADGVSRLLVRYKNNQKFSVTGFLAISRRKLGVSCSGIMQLARCEVLRTRKAAVLRSVNVLYNV